MSQRKRLSPSTSLKRALLFGLSVVAGLAMFGSPASAEGDWESYFEDVIVGFESRRWTDNDTDTNITRNALTDCTVTHQGNAMGWELWRNRVAAPDASYGVRTYENCDLSTDGQTERESWPSPGTSGTFYLKVSSVSSGSASAEVQYVSY